MAVFGILMVHLMSGTAHSFESVSDAGTCVHHLVWARSRDKTLTAENVLAVVLQVRHNSDVELFKPHGGRYSQSDAGCSTKIS